MQYAFLLIKEQPQRRAKLFLAAQERGGQYTLRLLLEGPTTQIPVVFRGEPGDYYGADERKTPVKIKHDVIVLETLEAGAVAFYFVGRKLKQLTISY